VEKEQGTERRFQPVYVGEPSLDDTIAILRGLKPRYEAHHGVKIRTRRWSRRPLLVPLHHRPVPADKAIDLVDEAASRVAMELEGPRRRLTKSNAVCGSWNWPPASWPTRPRTRPGRSSPTSKLKSARETEIGRLARQWEAEKLGRGDIQKMRQDYEQADLEFSRLEASIKEQQSSGLPVNEQDYQRLYELRFAPPAVASSRSRPKRKRMAIETLISRNTSAEKRSHRAGNREVVSAGRGSRSRA